MCVCVCVCVCVKGTQVHVSTITRIIGNGRQLVQWERGRHTLNKYQRLTLPPNIDFLLLPRALLWEGEAGIPPESLEGCERLDCEGDEGKFEIEQEFIDREFEM